MMYHPKIVFFLCLTTRLVAAAGWNFNDLHDQRSMLRTRVVQDNQSTRRGLEAETAMIEPEIEIENEPIETTLAETEPVLETTPLLDTELAETEPIETTPTETETVLETEPAVETTPVLETEPAVVTEAAATEPAETELVGAEAPETEPLEPESVEIEPVETEPVFTEPVETEPVLGTEPVETEPTETEPVLTEPAETEPVLGTEPVLTEPAETEPVVVTEPAETEPVLGTEPVETEPVETEPVVVTEPVETEPVEPEPVVVTEPVETAPEAEPVVEIEPTIVTETAETQISTEAENGAVLVQTQTEVEGDASLEVATKTAEVETLPETTEVMEGSDAESSLVADDFDATTRLAGEGEFPAFVEWQGLCGGSYIYPGVVLTAASCYNRLSRIVYVGGIAPEQGIKHHVMSKHRHPRYDRAPKKNHHQAFDFMVMGLKNAHDFIKPVQLNEEPHLPRYNQELTVLGYPMATWGNMVSSGGDTPDQVSSSDLPFQKPKDAHLQVSTTYALTGGTCLPFYGDEMDESVQFCGVAETDVCRGHAGGPVLGVDNNGNMIQMGIVSWSVGCTPYRHEETYPGMYARVSESFAWIHRMICEVAPQSPEDCVDVRINIYYDEYAYETGWVVWDLDNRAVAWANNGTVLEEGVVPENLRLREGPYRLQITDVGGKGLSGGRVTIFDGTKEKTYEEAEMSHDLEILFVAGKPKKYAPTLPPKVAPRTWTKAPTRPPHTQRPTIHHTPAPTVTPSEGPTMDGSVADSSVDTYTDSEQDSIAQTMETTEETGSDGETEDIVTPSTTPPPHMVTCSPAPTISPEAMVLATDCEEMVADDDMVEVVLNFDIDNALTPQPGPTTETSAPVPATVPTATAPTTIAAPVLTTESYAPVTSPVIVPATTDPATTSALVPADPVEIVPTPVETAPTGVTAPISVVATISPEATAPLVETVPTTVLTPVAVVATSSVPEITPGPAETVPTGVTAPVAVVATNAPGATPALVETGVATPTSVTEIIPGPVETVPNGVTTPVSVVATTTSAPEDNSLPEPVTPGVISDAPVAIATTSVPEDNSLPEPVTPEVITDAPVAIATTAVPVTAAPVTMAPTTQAPVTMAPVTAAPTTVPPVTMAPFVSDDTPETRPPTAAPSD